MRRKAISIGPYRLGPSGPPGSESGACGPGIPQEPGRPCMFHGKLKRTGTAFKALAPWRRCAGRGANPQRSRGTPKRRQRSAGGRHARSRSPLIVPTKAGRCPQATRWRKGTGRLDVLFEDQDEPDIELGTHLNATRKASVACEAPLIAGDDQQFLMLFANGFMAALCHGATV